MSDGIEPSDRRLQMRFVLGAVSLGAGWMTTHLRVWSREGREAQDSPPTPRRHLRFRVLGALVEVSERRAAARRGVRALPEAALAVDATRDTGRGRIAASARRVRRTAARTVARIRARVGARLDDWETIGRTEAARSRELARTGLVRTTARAVEWLSEQPAVQRMVAEQSKSLSHTALDQFRDATEAVDARADSVMRRLRKSLRRRRSATDHEEQDG